MSERLAGRVALVTGASSGIGAATAAACAAAGMRVALAARREDALRRVAAEIEAAGGEAIACPADLRQPGAADDVVARALERFGHVDVLVASAGTGCRAGVAEITDAELQAVVEVNLLGTMRSARAVLPHMIARGSGHVVTVGSVVTGIAWPDDAVYAATKAGVSRFAVGLRNEVARHGIHVTDVIAGVVDTPLSEGPSALPKAEPGQVARAIVAALRRPRRAVVVPPWYRALLHANRIFPGVVDAYLRRGRRPGSGPPA